MDKVVHFEIPADDQARAKEFYSSIFEWEVNDADMGGGVVYTTVKTVPTALPRSANRRHRLCSEFTIG